ncbi:heparan-alpha-glucosaminide N-acetyltransferase [Thermovenabulum sp.]|uniref:heparan-alpha-glucosaminide N-acetyltransferase n=1 Tax=Thermovenabulum sp. TaxID=3100335 RepID=UPI003C7D1ED8
MERIDEIDFLRGLAVILMVIFHIIFDLNYYLGIPVSYSRGFWYYEGKLSALMFIFLAGISVNFSKNYLLRGLKIFSLGILITLVTYAIDPDMYVKFGILHFMGVSYLLSFFFKKRNVPLLLMLSIVSIIIGIVFDGIRVENNFLFPLGLISDDFTSLDYYPVFPYFGVFLLGTAFFKTFYAKGKRLTAKHEKKNFFHLLGKNSLLIYLLHQPVILGLLFIYKFLIQFTQGGF